MTSFSLATKAEKALDAVISLLTGETKVFVEYPFDGEPDHTIRVGHADETLDGDG